MPMRPDMYNVFPERMAPLNGALGLSSGRLIAFRFDEGDACENAPCTTRLTASTRTTTKTVILGFTNDSVRRDGDRLNAFGVGSCLFIFPFRCASSFDNLVENPDSPRNVPIFRNTCRNACCIKSSASAEFLSMRKQTLYT